MSNKKTIIFMGGSGTGKGTQANLVEDKFLKNNEKVLHIELGDQFREFLSMTTFTADKANEIAKSGELQPEFLAIRLWANEFNLYYQPDKNLIIDGTPRTLREALVLESALKFYKIEQPIVIYLEASQEVLKKRMLSRGRTDDEMQKIDNRLAWFDKKVKPALEYFSQNDYFRYYKIDGERSIEEIAVDIEKIIFN